MKLLRFVHRAFRGEVQHAALSSQAVGALVVDELQVQLASRIICKGRRWNEQAVVTQRLIIERQAARSYYIYIMDSAGDGGGCCIYHLPVASAHRQHKE